MYLPCIRKYQKSIFPPIVIARVKGCGTISSPEKKKAGRCRALCYMGHLPARYALSCVLAARDIPCRVDPLSSRAIANPHRPLISEFEFCLPMQDRIGSLPEKCLLDIFYLVSVGHSFRLPAIRIALMDVYGFRGSRGFKLYYQTHPPPYDPKTVAPPYLLPRTSA